MTKRTDRAFIAMLLILLCVAISPPKSNAQEKPVIYWPYFNLPPQFIVNGSTPQGMGIDVAKLVQDRMPEFNHIFMHMTPRRIEEELRTGTNNIVVTGLLKTPSRTAFATFSDIPCRLTFSMMIIMRKEDRARFSTSSKIQLEELIKNNSLYFGYIPGVNYGPFADAINTNINNPEAVNLFAAHDIDQLLLMLKQKRIDWFVHDSLGAWHAMQANQLDSTMALVQAEGHPPSPIYGYMACPQTPSGMQIAKRVNQALAELIKSGTLRHELKKWMPRTLAPAFDKAYKAGFVRPLQ